MLSQEPYIKIKDVGRVKERRIPLYKCEVKAHVDAKI